jgi:hypothetical protein
MVGVDGPLEPVISQVQVYVQTQRPVLPIQVVGRNEVSRRTAEVALGETRRIAAPPSEIHSPELKDAPANRPVGIEAGMVRVENRNKYDEE